MRHKISFTSSNQPKEALWDITSKALTIELTRASNELLKTEKNTARISVLVTITNQKGTEEFKIFSWEEKRTISHTI